MCNRIDTISPADLSVGDLMCITSDASKLDAVFGHVTSFWLNNQGSAYFVDTKEYGCFKVWSQVEVLRPCAAVKVSGVGTFTDGSVMI